MNAKGKGNKHRQYGVKKLRAAVQAVRNGGKLREICRQYGVPKSTLQDWVKRKGSDIVMNMGPEPVLTMEFESKVVKWIGDLAKCGLPIKKKELYDVVEKIVQAENLKTPFKNGRPGETWYRSFMRRHPELPLKNAEALEKYRSQITEEYIRTWFKDLESFLMNVNATDILYDPSRMLYADEIGFSLCPKTGKVLGLKGHDLNVVKFGDTKENLTALITFTADGRLCPPLIIFPYAKPPRAVVDSMPIEWVLGKTDSGRMKSNVFYEYVANSLDKWLKQAHIKRPVLFFIDGHKSHMSLELSKFCDQNDIIFYSLPPNATHLLQPADVAVFKPLKKYWRKEVREWQAKYENRVITKTDFCPIFQKVLQNPNIPTNMKNGFKASGLFPFNPDAVNCKYVQNALENLSNKADKVQDEIITADDINSAKKVILKLQPQLSQRGICTDSIVSLIQSLLPQRSDRNEMSYFTEEEIDNMELVFNGETPVEESKVIILENPILNPNQEKQINENLILEKEQLTQDEIKIVGNNVLHEEKAEQENIKEDVQKPARLILDAERLQKDISYEEVQVKKLCDENVLDTQNNYQETGSGNVVRIQSNNAFSLYKQDTPNTSKKSSEILKGSQIKRPMNDSFKKHLLYLQPVIKNVKKREKEKIPSAISSNAWQQNYENKQKERGENKNLRKRSKVGVNKKNNKNTKSKIPEEKMMKGIEKGNEYENDDKQNQNGYNGFKEKCGKCQEEVESDAEIENEKNVGCDTCPRWFHLGCTNFTGLSYRKISSLYFICDFCNNPMTE